MIIRPLLFGNFQKSMFLYSPFGKNGVRGVLAYIHAHPTGQEHVDRMWDAPLFTISYFMF